MPYIYRCQQCASRSEPVATRRAARSERDWHRARVHAGLIPDGESIEQDTETGLDTGGLVVAILAGCLIAGAISRVLGR